MVGGKGNDQLLAGLGSSILEGGTGRILSIVELLLGSLSS